jgi:hypothetical protein
MHDSQRASHQKQRIITKSNKLAARVFLVDGCLMPRDLEEVKDGLRLLLL